MLLFLLLSGIFTLALGVTHVFMPILFDFEGAIPLEGRALKPLRLLFYRYDTKRSDVLGIAWVMNHSVSFVLLSIGVAELSFYFGFWAGIDRLFLFWIAAWWFLRAACQFYLGRRPGDWFVVGWFGLLGILHVVAGIRG